MSHSTPRGAPAAPRTDDPEAWLAQFLAEAQAMERQANAASRALSEIEATVENSFMRLTLTGGGTVRRLVFRPSANAATAAQLTEVFAATLAEAGAEVTRRTLAVMADLAGPDDPSLGAIRAAVPEVVREELAVAPPDAAHQDEHDRGGDDQFEDDQFEDDQFDEHHDQQEGDRDDDDLGTF